MKRHCPILIGLACFPLSACAQDPAYAEMIALRTSSGFANALRSAETRLSTNPDDGVAWAVSALVYGNGGDYLGMGAEAGELRERALEHAMRLSSNDPYTRAAYGMARMSSHPLEAEVRLRQCIDETPAFLECHNLYGDLLRKTGRADEAGNVYRDALEVWPDDGELRISYALQLQEIGRPRQAVDVLRALVAEQPGFARGHWHLATMLFETQRDPAGARKGALRALELDPLIWNGQQFLRMLDEVENAGR